MDKITLDKDYKFRVYDLIRKEMISPEKVLIGTTGYINRIIIIDEDKLIDLSPLHCKVMQFVNKKDICFQDIFDGDILKFDWDGVDIISVMENKRDLFSFPFVYPIILSELKHDDLYLQYPKFFPWDKSYIIGNIYENKELIEEFDDKRIF